MVMAKAKVVKAKKKAELLGAIKDAKRKSKKHMAGAAAQGLSLAMCLRRLKTLALHTARQLFMVIVAPKIDYASVI
jgi:hypothetical protein